MSPSGNTGSQRTLSFVHQVPPFSPSPPQQSRGLSAAAAVKWRWRRGGDRCVPLTCREASGGRRRRSQRHAMPSCHGVRYHQSGWCVHGVVLLENLRRGFLNDSLTLLIHAAFLLLQRSSPRFISGNLGGGEILLPGLRRLARTHAANGKRLSSFFPYIVVGGGSHSYSGEHRPSAERKEVERMRVVLMWGQRKRALAPLLPAQRCIRHFRT